MPFSFETNGFFGFLEVCSEILKEPALPFRSLKVLGLQLCMNLITTVISAVPGLLGSMSSCAVCQISHALISSHLWLFLYFMIHCYSVDKAFLYVFSSKTNGN